MQLLRTHINIDDFQFFNGTITTQYCPNNHFQSGVLTVIPGHFNNDQCGYSSPSIHQHNLSENIPFSLVRVSCYYKLNSSHSSAIGPEWRPWSWAQSRTGMKDIETQVDLFFVPLTFMCIWTGDGVLSPFHYATSSTDTDVTWNWVRHLLSLHLLLQIHS